MWYDLFLASLAMLVQVDTQTLPVLTQAEHEIRNVIAIGVVSALCTMYLPRAPYWL